MCGRSEGELDKTKQTGQRVVTMLEEEVKHTQHIREKLCETKLKLVQANQLNQFHKTYNIESRFFYFIVIIVKVYIDSTIGSEVNTEEKERK